MGDWKFTVSPPHKTFDTRAEAAAFKAIYTREYTIRRLGSGEPVEPRIEAYEVIDDD